MAAPTPGVALITGASRGIGAAIALRAAAAGYAVVVNFSNDENGAAEIVDRIGRDGGSALAVRGDVAEPGTAAALFNAAEGLGTVTAVVNNAAITGDVIGELTQVSPETIKRVLDVNAAGTIFMCQEAVRRMSRQSGRQGGGQGGSIVNISSTAVKAGSPGTWVHYAASKGAIDVLTVGLATEAAPQGIRVNAVSPGTTKTGLHAAAGMPDRVEQVKHLIPLGRGGEPDDVAAAVLWLLSEDASYITGAILPVAGGR